jgi:hypothetical protein
MWSEEVLRGVSHTAEQLAVSSATVMLLWERSRSCMHRVEQHHGQQCTLAQVVAATRGPAMQCRPCTVEQLARNPPVSFLLCAYEKEIR